MEIDTNLNTSDTLEGLSDEKGFLNDIISSVPGIDEAMCFAELMKQVQNLSYSCVVFDTAPTGHTLRLLSFPTVLEKAFAKLNTIKDKFGGMMQGMSSMMGQGNEENILEKLEEMQVNVRKIRENFENPDFTTFVCVCIPEFLSLFETERLVQELGNYSIDVSNIVVNQVLFPDECSDCRKCKARTKMQKKYLDQIDLLYDGFSVVKMPLLDQEVRSKDSLLKFGDMLRTGVADSRALPETD
jgi:arsenite-transporting ATPase